MNWEKASGVPPVSKKQKSVKRVVAGNAVDKFISSPDTCWRTIYEDWESGNSIVNLEMNKMAQMLREEAHQRNAKISVTKCKDAIYMLKE